MFRPMDTSATPTPHPPDLRERGFSSTDGTAVILLSEN